MEKTEISEGDIAPTIANAVRGYCSPHCMSRYVDMLKEGTHGQITNDGDKWFVWVDDYGWFLLSPVHLTKTEYVLPTASPRGGPGWICAGLS